MGQYSVIPRRDPQDVDSNFVFVVPGHLHFSENQMNIMANYGQQPGVPFAISGQSGATGRPDQRRFRLIYSSNLVSIKKTTIKIIPDTLNSNRYSLSFIYDALVQSEVIIRFGVTDLSDNSKITFSYIEATWGPFTLESGSGITWSSSDMKLYFTESQLPSRRRKITYANNYDIAISLMPIYLPPPKSLHTKDVDSSHPNLLNPTSSLLLPFFFTSPSKRDNNKVTQRPSGTSNPTTSRQESVSPPTSLPAITHNGPPATFLEEQIRHLQENQELQQQQIRRQQHLQQQLQQQLELQKAQQEEILHHSQHNIVQPVTTQPVTTQPVVTQPVVTQPVVTQPVVTQPVVTQPVVTQPVVTQPVVTQPVVTQPVVTQPVVTQPVVTQPVVTQPVVTQPVVTQPVVTQPVVTQPVVTQPVVTQPVVTQPVVTQPVVTQPVVTQPSSSIDSTPSKPLPSMEVPNPSIQDSDKSGEYTPEKILDTITTGFWTLSRQLSLSIASAYETVAQDLNLPSVASTTSAELSSNENSSSTSTETKVGVQPTDEQSQNQQQGRHHPASISSSAITTPITVPRSHVHTSSYLSNLSRDNSREDVDLRTAMQGNHRDNGMIPIYHSRDIYGDDDLAMNGDKFQGQDSLGSYSPSTRLTSASFGVVAPSSAIVYPITSIRGRTSSSSSQTSQRGGGTANAATAAAAATATTTTTADHPHPSSRGSTFIPRQTYEGIELSNPLSIPASTIKSRGKASTTSNTANVTYSITSNSGNVNATSGKQLIVEVSYVRATGGTATGKPLGLRCYLQRVQHASTIYYVNNIYGLENDATNTNVITERPDGEVVDEDTNPTVNSNLNANTGDVTNDPTIDSKVEVSDSSKQSVSIPINEENKERTIKPESEKPTNTTNITSSGADNQDNGGEECVICLSDARTVALYPCRHTCLCLSCATNLSAGGNKCPICRRQVSLLLNLKPGTSTNTTATSQSPTISIPPTETVTMTEIGTRMTLSSPVSTRRTSTVMPSPDSTGSGAYSPAATVSSSRRYAGVRRTY